MFLSFENVTLVDGWVWSVYASGSDPSRRRRSSVLENLPEPVFGSSGRK
jgi:hypothetical protein